MEQLPLIPGSWTLLPLEPTCFQPPPIERPREFALGYVAKLLERGYTEKQALEEGRLGVHQGDGVGYELARGVIYLPLIGPTKFTFKFAELAAEVRARSNSNSSETRDLKYVHG